ncbi:unnamed protein product, partial [Amoebophrya sp. A120]
PESPVVYPERSYNQQTSTTAAATSAGGCDLFDLHQEQNLSTITQGNLVNISEFSTTVAPGGAGDEIVGLTTPPSNSKNNQQDYEQSQCEGAVDSCCLWSTNTTRVSQQHQAPANFCLQTPTNFVRRLRSPTFDPKV